MAEGFQPASFTAILRGHILSVRSPQVRYVVHGTKGTFLKYGVDVQEDQLKVIPTPALVFSDDAYGMEPEDIWGTVDHFGEDGKIVRTQYVSSASFKVFIVLTVCNNACRGPSTERGSYAKLYENAAAVIRDGAEQAVKWEESAEVIEIIELAYQSAREERTVLVPPRQ